MSTSQKCDGIRTQARGRAQSLLGAEDFLDSAARAGDLRPAARSKGALSSSAGLLHVLRWPPWAQRLELFCLSPAKLEVPLTSENVVFVC